MPLLDQRCLKYILLGVRYGDADDNRPNQIVPLDCGTRRCSSHVGAQRQSHFIKPTSELGRLVGRQAQMTSLSVRCLPEHVLWAKAGPFVNSKRSARSQTKTSTAAMVELVRGSRRLYREHYSDHNGDSHGSETDYCSMRPDRSLSTNLTADTPAR